VLIAAVLEKITLANGRALQRFAFWISAALSRDTYSLSRRRAADALNKPPRAGDREHSVRIAWGGGCPARNVERICRTLRRADARRLRPLRNDHFRDHQYRRPIGSIGKPLSYFDVKLIDDNGAESRPACRRAA